jgi:hypothetical protein
VYPWPGYQTVLQGLRVSLVNCKRPWPECVRETFDSPAGRAGQIPEMASAVGALQKQQIDVGTDVCPSPVTINSETVAQLKFWCSNRREDCLKQFDEAIALMGTSFDVDRCVVAHQQAAEEAEQKKQCEEAQEQARKLKEEQDAREREQKEKQEADRAHQQQVKEQTDTQRRQEAGTQREDDRDRRREKIEQNLKNDQARFEAQQQYVAQQQANAQAMGDAMVSAGQADVGHGQLRGLFSVGFGIGGVGSYGGNVGQALATDIVVRRIYWFQGCTMGFRGKECVGGIEVRANGIFVTKFGNNDTLDLRLGGRLTYWHRALGVFLGEDWASMSGTYNKKDFSLSYTRTILGPCTSVHRQDKEGGILLCGGATFASDGGMGYLGEMRFGIGLANIGLEGWYQPAADSTSTSPGSVMRQEEWVGLVAMGLRWPW